LKQHSRIKPWNLAVHILSPLPLVWLVYLYVTGQATFNPAQFLEQRTGDTAIVFLLLSLACTPVNILFGFKPAINLRRPLGVYAFGYAMLHLFVFVGLDYAFNWTFLWADLYNKIYIIAGLSALLLLIPLAATSWKWWQKRLGKTWTALHRIVYAAGVLAVLHLAWVVKGNLLTLRGDIWKPFLASIVLALLLLSRVKPVRRALVRWRQAVVSKVRSTGGGDEHGASQPVEEIRR
jgi:methionine sulfoxide reductase heme-binding subunit